MNQSAQVVVEENWWFLSTTDAFYDLHTGDRDGAANRVKPILVVDSKDSILALCSVSLCIHLSRPLHTAVQIHLCKSVMCSMKAICSMQKYQDDNLLDYPAFNWPLYILSNKMGILHPAEAVVHTAYCLECNVVNMQFEKCPWFPTSCPLTLSLELSLL